MFVAPNANCRTQHILRCDQATGGIQCEEERERESRLPTPSVASSLLLPHAALLLALRPTVDTH
jgi:hypothetical protein